MSRDVRLKIRGGTIDLRALRHLLNADPEQGYEVCVTLDGSVDNAASLGAIVVDHDTKRIVLMPQPPKYGGGKTP